MKKTGNQRADAALPTFLDESPGGAVPAEETVAEWPETAAEDAAEPAADADFEADDDGGDGGFLVQERRQCGIRTLVCGLLHRLSPLGHRQEPGGG